MGRLLGLVLKLLAIVGITAIARPKAPGAARDPATLTPAEREVAARLPTPAQAAEAGERATHSPPPGWNRPKPETTPRPTYWPAVLAMGLTFAAWGLISNLFVFFTGLLLFVIAIAGWIGDLLHEFG